MPKPLLRFSCCCSFLRVGAITQVLESSSTLAEAQFPHEEFTCGLWFLIDHVFQFYQHLSRINK